MRGRIELPPHARTVLANGLTIIVLERHRLPLVTLRLVLPAGAVHEPPHLVGLSSLTARLVRRGAGDRDAATFSEELDVLGGHLGCLTGFDHAVVESEFTTETLDAGLELYLDALLAPRFEASEVAAERERVIAEIVQSRDDAEEVADEAYLHHVHGDHPYASCALASTTAVGRVGRDDVARFHATRYRPEGALLVVVGDVDRGRFLARMAEAFAGWTGDGPPPPPPPPTRRSGKRRVVLVDDPEATQVQYRTGDVGIERASDLWHAAALSNTIFGGGFTSRLVDQVRVERGLTYGISSRLIAGRVAGPFTISSFTRTEAVTELDSVISKELAAFRQDGPSDAELTAAKAYLVGLQPRRVETPEGLASSIAEAELFGLGPQEITEYRSRVEAVTRAEASEAARRAFPDESRLTVLVGDADALRETAASMGELTELSLDFAEGAVADPPREITP